MATAAPRPWYERPLTHRDIDDLPEDEHVRYEVIDGELYMAPFPFITHQQVATALVAILWAHLKQHPVGRVFLSNTKVVLDEPTGVGPDLVYVAREHLGMVREDGIYGAPDLMVEVTSSKPNQRCQVDAERRSRSAAPWQTVRSSEARRAEGDTNLDRVVKYRKYASAGVRRYWIIDPQARTLDAFELRGDRYELVAEVKGDATFEPTLFPGLAIPLADLWG